MEEQIDFDPSIAEEFGYAIADVPTWLGAPLYDTQALWNLLFRFAFNLIVTWVIARCFYYRKSRRRDYLLTFILFSSAMFLLIFLMENVKLQIGFTLGLFAIFGMIRYRTEVVPVREMTYLFVIIAVSVINGLSLNVSHLELLVANLLVLGLIWVTEYARWIKHISSKVVLYDRLELIVPERREELLADLHKRLGIEIDHIEIGSVDFLRDSCYIKVYYPLASGEMNTIDNYAKLK